MAELHRNRGASVEKSTSRLTPIDPPPFLELPTIKGLASRMFQGTIDDGMRDAELFTLQAEGYR